MKNLTLRLAAIGSLSLLAIVPSHAVAPSLVITEVDANGSSSSLNTYNEDWFELTNFSTSAVDITGWKMDDNSNSFSLAVPLTGVTSIGAGQTVVFLEDTSTPFSSDATLDAAFKTYWGPNASGITIGNYGGSGVGLGNGGDAVNIFDSTGTLRAGVVFGTASATATFDNSVAKITNTGSTDGSISTLSVAGTDGAFTSANAGSGGSHEIGSPGAVPEPSSGALAAVAAMVLGFFAWRRQAATRA